MSYQTLADQLRRTADAIGRHEAALQGAKLAAAAKALDTALAKFAAALQESVRGVDPAALALRGLLETDAARQHLDAKTLRSLAKGATGKTLTLKASDSPADQRRRFLEAAVKLGRVDDANVAVKALLAGATRPAPDPSDREHVLAELWRLATLGEVDLEVEKARLLANPGLLRAMAGYAYVKVTARSAPKTVFANLLKFARRVQENTA